MSAVGFGTVVQPFIASHLTLTFGWRGAFTITGALVLHICPLALLIGVLSKEQLKSGLEVPEKIICDSLEYVSVDSNANSMKNKGDESIAIALTLPESKHKQTLLNIDYVILHVNCVLFCFGQSIVYTHIVAYGMSCGHSLDRSAVFVSLIGFSNFIGRIFTGFIARNSIATPLCLHCLFYVTAGVCCILFCVTSSYIQMLALIAIFGFTIASYGPLLTELTLDAAPVGDFARAYGLLLVSQAAGTLFGAPVAGFVYDVTHIYEISLVAGGVIIIVSGLIMHLPKCFKC